MNDVCKAVYSWLFADIDVIFNGVRIVLLSFIFLPFCFCSANPNVRLSPKLGRQISLFTQSLDLAKD